MPLGIGTPKEAQSIAQGDYTTMRKILEIIFLLMFVFTGCSVDSALDGHLVEWVIAFIVLLAIAMVIGGNDE